MLFVKTTKTQRKMSRSEQKVFMRKRNVHAILQTDKQLTALIGNTNKYAYGKGDGYKRNHILIRIKKSLDCNKIKL